MATVVRRVRADEGPLLESVRLAALADSPSAFGSSYAAEADQPADRWAERATRSCGGAQRHLLRHRRRHRRWVGLCVPADSCDALGRAGLDVGVAATSRGRDRCGVGDGRRGLGSPDRRGCRRAVGHTRQRCCGALVRDRGLPTDRGPPATAVGPLQGRTPNAPTPGLTSSPGRRRSGAPWGTAEIAGGAGAGSRRLDHVAVRSLRRAR